MFFTSLITPAILLVLYATFLGNVYRDSFSSAMPDYFTVSDQLINATVGGELFSSLLAVCCVTVAFCSNMLMVQDKVSGARRDLTMTPVKKSTLAMGYYTATFISTLIICLIATGLCFIYLAHAGWYLSAADTGLYFSGCGIAGAVWYGAFLHHQYVSFLTGADLRGRHDCQCRLRLYLRRLYADLSVWRRAAESGLFSAGTYGTSLIRNHALRGVFAEMQVQGFPAEVIEGIRDSIDCNLYFFGNQVTLSAMYWILGGAVVLLIGVYVLLNILMRRGR